MAAGPEAESAPMAEPAAGPEAGSAGLGRAALGVLVVLLLVCGNVASSELTQSFELFFPEPFALIYINHGMMVLLLPASGWATARRFGSIGTGLGRLGLRGPWHGTAVAVLLAVLFMYNVAFALALEHTDANVFLAISQASLPITLVLSAVVLSEPVGLAKVGSVVVSLGGVALVSFGSRADRPTGQTTWLGVAFSLLFAAGQSIFQVAYKRLIRDEEPLLVSLLMGLIGLATLLVLLPVLPVLDVLGWEKFVWPAARHTGMILAGALLAVFNNFMFCYATTVTTPVFVAVGSLLQIPIGAVADLIFHHTMPTLMMAAGWLLIAASFLACVWIEANAAPKVSEQSLEQPGPLDPLIVDKSQLAAPSAS